LRCKSWQLTRNQQNLLHIPATLVHTNRGWGWLMKKHRERSFADTAFQVAGPIFLLLSVSACSGGGGGAPNTGTNNTPPIVTPPPPPPPPAASIGSPDRASVTIMGSGLVINPPAVGTVFALAGPAVKVAFLSPSTLVAADKGTDGTLTYRGRTPEGVPLVDINIPAINLSANNVPADGRHLNAPAGDSTSVVLGGLNLTYTTSIDWTYVPKFGTYYEGVAVSGSGTPIANLPASGTAIYSAICCDGGTQGQYYVPDDKGLIAAGSLMGNIAVTVNLGTGAVSGSLTKMIWNIPGGDGTTWKPWNDVALSGNVSRTASNASFAGTARASAAPSDTGNAGFSSAATGEFAGAFFGPNAEEIGGTWTLTDQGGTSGGKTAVGIFGARSAGCSLCSITPAAPSPTPGASVSITPPGFGATTFSDPASGSSFNSNPPAIGAAIPVSGGAAAITSSSLADFSAGSVTATYRGTVTNGGATYPLFDLNIPALSVTAANVRGDGTTVVLADGGKVSATVSTLNYAMMGAWRYFPAAGGTSYVGQIASGYGTPLAAIPATGSAIYSGTGTVNGTYAAPSGANSIETGTLTGDTSFGVNFSNNEVTGVFLNMKSKAAGSSTTTPWNSPILNGNLIKGANAATLDGRTTVRDTTVPSVAAFSTSATGTFHGALYGPAALEVAGVCVLTDPTASGGGKAAFGTFGAKQ
jgi:hypothetical protein